MTCVFLLPLGISAALRILDLGTHCFMGPLGLVLEGLLFTSCTMCFELDCFWLTDTSDHLVLVSKKQQLFCSSEPLTSRYQTLFSADFEEQVLLSSES